MPQLNFDDLKKSFQGSIILPSNDGYENARTTIGSKGNPAVIFYPANSDDIVVALGFVRDNSLLLSVRSGGHSVAGFASNNDGAVVDLSKINSVDVINAEKNLVRIGAGARWGDVAIALQDYQLALSSGDTKSVGVGGLTLGGGIGWMVRKYGLAIDSLVAAEVITAEGKILRASMAENTDLFWAIRGGGGNFGIVTYFEFIAHPCGSVYSGMMMFTLDNLPQLLKSWRDYMRIADESLTTILNIMPSFGGNPPGVMLLCCYAGDDEKKAMEALEPLKKMGKITMQNIVLKKYSEVLEEARPPEGIRVVVNNVFIENFSDEILETIITTQSKNPTLFLQVRSLGGAMNRVSEKSTAFSYHNCEVMLMGPLFVAPNATDNDIEQALKPWKTIAQFGKGSYSGFLSTAAEKDVAAVYPTETYNRLVVIKKKYDAKNLFNQNFNIKP